MFVSKLEFAQHKRQVIRIIEMQRLKLKLLEKEIKINSIDARIQLTVNKKAEVLTSAFCM